MSIDALATAAQFVRRMPTNWAAKNFFPNAEIDSLADERLFPLLEEKGIKGVIVDVDSTITKYHGTEVDDTVADTFAQLCETYPVVILSNSNEARFCELGTVFPDIPVLRAYEGRTAELRWHGFRAYRRLFRGFSTLDPDPHFDSSPEVRSIHQTDSPGLHPRLTYYRALRKPNPLLFNYAQRELGINDQKKVVVIGDRHSTDISGGNQAGMYTIKVAPLRPETEPFTAKLGRRIENAVKYWHVA
ncbi:MAG: HAD hydrolase-like protein [Candidatus Woesearchaeota archaeon]|nr:HAD hydrolase-like protein [Candidatus Woesearchaeota archaeon]